jgi:hypothetical protein
MTIYFAPPDALGGPTHEGSLGNTRYISGIIARQLVRSGSSVKYITASFVLDNPSGAKIVRIWYYRARRAVDMNITLSTSATYLRRGDSAGYSIHQHHKNPVTLKGGGVLDYLELPVGQGNFSGKGQFGFEMDFEGMTDDDTFIVGVEFDA